MADSDIPAEAVEAGVAALVRSLRSESDPPEGDYDTVTQILAAALPPIRGRVLAEVDAALRKEADRIEKAEDEMDLRCLCATFRDAVDYLRDVLGAGGEQ